MPKIPFMQENRKMEKIPLCTKMPKNSINAGKCRKIPLMQKNSEKFH
jgi:hypothetical protein